LSLAAKNLARAVELRRSHLGPEHPATLVSQAGLAAATGNLKLADQVLRVRRRVLGADHEATLSSLFRAAYRANAAIAPVP
jgi:hypothetical protein